MQLSTMLAIFVFFFVMAHSAEGDHFTLTMRVCRGAETATVHGFKPEFENENCDHTHYNDLELSDVDLTGSWKSCHPNVDDATHLESQWAHFGRCSGMNGQDYFAKGLELLSSHGASCQENKQNCRVCISQDDYSVMDCPQRSGRKGRGRRRLEETNGRTKRERRETAHRQRREAARRKRNHSEGKQRTAKHRARKSRAKSTKASKRRSQAHGQREARSAHTAEGHERSGKQHPRQRSSQHHPRAKSGQHHPRARSAAHHPRGKAAHPHKMKKGSRKMFKGRHKRNAEHPEAAEDLNEKEEA